MTDTIAIAELPRLGRTDVNAELDQLVGETFWLTTTQLADLISVDQVLGEPGTDSAGPVGRWVLSQLQAVGIDATLYTWGRNLAVYDSARGLIGEVHIPETHTLWGLECEVNDLERPELCWQGDGDPR